MSCIMLRRPSPPALAPRVAEVRAFNRFYTRLIGLLDEGHLATRFSLAQGRVLYEIAQRGRPIAADLTGALGIDPGYLSRMVQALQADGLVAKRPSTDDKRRQHLELTAAGRRAVAELERRTDAAIAGVLERVPPGAEDELVGAMRGIRAVLDPAPPAVVLRAPRPGDLGWIVHRHGVLYAREHGWDERFEAVVAQIVADFVARFDPARARCWIADRGGAIVGSVFVIARSATVAQLRLLYVEPTARGAGIGSRLVGECVKFARAAGYRRMMLSTNSGLVAARRIYEAAGFRRVGEDPRYSFGDGLVGQTWVLRL
jgi:DNA-binding MarR family transcriptional regulator/predicted N-acetyltransferase YhbS